MDKKKRIRRARYVANGLGYEIKKRGGSFDLVAHPKTLRMGLSLEDMEDLLAEKLKKDQDEEATSQGS